jgi:hypothetical protein
LTSRSHPAFERISIFPEYFAARLECRPAHIVHNFDGFVNRS